MISYVHTHTRTLQYKCKCHTIPLHYFTFQKTHIYSTLLDLTLYDSYTHPPLLSIYIYIDIDISTHVVYWCILIIQFISYTLHMYRCLTLHIVLPGVPAAAAAAAAARQKSKFIKVLNETGGVQGRGYFYGKYGIISIYNGLSTISMENICVFFGQSIVNEGSNGKSSANGCNHGNLNTSHSWNMGPLWLWWYIHKNHWTCTPGNGWVLQCM